MQVEYLGLREEYDEESEEAVGIPDVVGGPC